MQDNLKEKFKRGGKRNGAGRPKGEKMYKHQFNLEYAVFRSLKNKLGTPELNKKIIEFCKELDKSKASEP